MKHIRFYFDFISPYAYLAFERLPQALMGLSYSVDYQPILFAGLLKHHGQRGPAEIAPKRDWTYRQVLWLAHQHGVALDLPAAHPFNPLGLLRLALACGDGGLPNRYQCERIFHHVWRGGGDAASSQRLAALTAELRPSLAADSDEVKQALKTATEAAVTAGLFGVPSFAVDDKLFWGFDALPMLRAWLENDPWFSTAAWQQAATLPAAVQRA